MVADMNSNTPPLIETAATRFAILCLASAVGFAAWHFLPFAGLTGAGMFGAIAALAGWVVLARVDRPQRLVAFVPVDLPMSEETSEDVLLPDQLADLDLDLGSGPEPLLLDDPLPALRDDMRVVRLFAAGPAERRPAALAGPGEMIAQIEDFLGQPRVGGIIARSGLGDGAPRTEDASAALHAALADIRRSLRQA